MTGRDVLQFGEARPGITYTDRPSAYLVVERGDGAILCVRADSGEVRLVVKPRQ